MRTLSMRISFLRACSVLMLSSCRVCSVSAAYAQHGLKALYEFGIFTLMLSIRVRNWCVRSAYASADAYAQRTHQFLTCMLRVHRKKRFTSFRSPAGMSLTKLSLGRNNSVMTSLFPPRECLVVTYRLGTGNSRTFFLRCTHQSLMRMLSMFWRDCAP